MRRMFVMASAAIAALGLAAASPALAGGSHGGGHGGGHAAAHGGFAGRGGGFGHGGAYSAMGGHGAMMGGHGQAWGGGGHFNGPSASIHPRDFVFGGRQEGHGDRDRRFDRDHFAQDRFDRERFDRDHAFGDRDRFRRDHDHDRFGRFEDDEFAFGGFGGFYGGPYVYGGDEWPGGPYLDDGYVDGGVAYGDGGPAYDGGFVDEGPAYGGETQWGGGYYDAGPGQAYGGEGWRGRDCSCGEWRGERHGQDRDDDRR